MVAVVELDRVELVRVIPAVAALAVATRSRAGLPIMEIPVAAIEAVAIGPLNSRPAEIEEVLVAAVTAVAAA